MQPHFTTAPMEQTTHYGPLVALGFFVREHDLWSPIQSRLLFAHKTHTEHPIDALLDMCVGILAGCEVVSQINTTIHPDLLLASAWGRQRFAEQSTISRVLDTCGAEQVSQMREANEALLKWTGQVHHHDFAQHWLRLDLDLTGLLTSKLAEGSTKGYFAGKKTLQAVNWPGSAQPIIAKCCSRNCTPVHKPAWPLCSPPFWSLSGFVH